MVEGLEGGALLTMGSKGGLGAGGNPWRAQVGVDSEHRPSPWGMEKPFHWQVVARGGRLVSVCGGGAPEAWV